MWFETDAQTTERGRQNKREQQREREWGRKGERERAWERDCVCVRE